MKHYNLILLLAVLFIPAYGYSEPLPPQGPDCPCNTAQIPNDGPTGSELLAEICPGGRLAADGGLILKDDELAVFLDDPRREFRVEIDTENDNDLFCALTQAPESIGILGLTTEQFENCRETVVFACGLQTRPIPTVSQWGLIALAAVFGVIGLFVIRKKRATA